MPRRHGVNRFGMWPLESRVIDRLLAIELLLALRQRIFQAAGAVDQRGACSLPSSKALTIGAQPAACTAIMRGRLEPMKPIFSSSSNAFHMPIRPVPPPVG